MKRILILLLACINWEIAFCQNYSFNDDKLQSYFQLLDIQSITSKERIKFLLTTNNDLTLPSDNDNMYGKLEAIGGNPDCLLVLNGMDFYLDSTNKEVVLSHKYNTHISVDIHWFDDNANLFLSFVRDRSLQCGYTAFSRWTGAQNKALEEIYKSHSEWCCYVPNSSIDFICRINGVTYVYLCSKEWGDNSFITLRWEDYISNDSLRNVFINESLTKYTYSTKKHRGKIEIVKKPLSIRYTHQVE